MGYVFLKRLLISLLFSLSCIHCPLFTSSSEAGTVPKRIISLAPNMTEILFALGLGDRIVGVTNFCDYPAQAKEKPKVGGMSNPSLERVISLKPDIVVMTTDGNPKEFQERLRAMKIRTYVSTARRLRDLASGVRDLGAALGVEDRAEQLARETETRLAALASNRASHPRKKVLFIVWPEPLIVAGPGTVIDDALTLIGVNNIASVAKTEYPKYSIEELLRQSPDLLIIGRGMDSKDVKKVSEGLLEKIRTLPAVKSNKVFFVSDDLYRLGPRTLSGIEEISALTGR